MLTAEQMVQRYQDSMARGDTKQKYIQGVQSVTESPMAKAATPEALELYRRRTEESVTSGRRAQRLLATPLSRYKDNAIAKADRLASGAKAALDKSRAHFQKWAPIYQSVKDAVANMAKGGREEAKARNAKAIDMMMDAAGRQ